MSDDESNGRRPPGPEESLSALPSADELADLQDDLLVAHAVGVLAELKDRGLLRVLLRNRSDLGTLFDADEIRFANGTVEIVPEGFHAETPEDYGEWIQEADALHEQLTDPNTTLDEAEALVRHASSEALLLELDRAEDAEGGDGLDQLTMPTPADTEGGHGIRIVEELKRRGAIEERTEH